MLSYKLHLTQFHNETSTKLCSLLPLMQFGYIYLQLTLVHPMEFTWLPRLQTSKDHTLNIWKICTVPSTMLCKDLSSEMF